MLKNGVYNYAKPQSYMSQLSSALYEINRRQDNSVTKI